MRLLSIFLIVAAVSANAATIKTYEELESYKFTCENVDKDIDMLLKLRNAKKFDQDPDKLSDEDWVFNGRIKASIWVLIAECKQ